MILLAKKKKTPQFIVSAIVCLDKNMAIGNKGHLLFSLPEELKHFSRITSKKMLIMGRKTYESLPKKPLPNRLNVVVTSNGTDKIDKNGTYKTPQFVTMRAVIEYLEFERAQEDTLEKDLEVCVIGGEQIYKELLPFCNRLLITRVLTQAKEADAYFPDYERDPKWNFDFASEIYEENGIKYQYRIYEKKKNKKK